MHQNKSILISHPWSLHFQDILNKLEVDAEEGLDKKDVTKRQKQFGPNRLRQIKKKGIGQIFINQFKSIIIAILAIASILSFIFTDWIDGVVIAVAILLNTIIGFLMELKAVRSMEALKQMERISAKVLRNGRIIEIQADQLVPGDIVLFEGGDLVSADMRLIELSKLQVDESMLTGESVPVSKQIEPIDEKVSVSDKNNMLFKGTAITRGSGKAVVTQTGMNTELGHISSLVEKSEEEFTPLEKQLGKFGRTLIWITLAILIVLTILGISRGKEILIMIETSVALAVAAIPEGLPIVATIAMARGMLRMAKQSALVNRLAAVETLGATNVICTDKTGTLTENEMTVTHIVLKTGKIIVKEKKTKSESSFEKDGELFDPDHDEILQDILKVCVLCNNASLEENSSVGDPLESALLAAGAKAGLNRSELLKKYSEEREEAFDTTTKMMATFHKNNDHYFVAVKGAPEAVLQHCSQVKENAKEHKFDEEEYKLWINHNEELAKKGLRVLALAYKKVKSIDIDPYKELILLGLIGMMDPPREDVKKAIGLCKNAGLKVVMVTGDQAQTALHIASEIGLIEHDNETVIMGSEIKPSVESSEQEKEKFLKASIFARVNPEQKFNLVSLHQNNGSTVAMTGDGVNDAPGLKKADIGIAMGQRGTQVAREASDMVLKDDSFSTIVIAIEQGRIIFNNIRKFIIYLLSGNSSEIMIVFIASLLNSPLPILPLQILLLNIINDVFPALALGLGKGSEDVMKYSPRSAHEPVLKLSHWFAVFGYGVLIAIPVLIAFTLSHVWLKMEATEAVTVSFLTLAFARLWHIFNMRDPQSGFISNEIIKNKYVWIAIVLCTVLLLSVVYIPNISGVLKLTSPDSKVWILILAMSMIPLAIGQIFKKITSGHVRKN